MKKYGFTYIEVMIATTIFIVLSIIVVRLNIESNKNVNIQVDKQNMMMEAQKILEKSKTNPVSVGDNNFNSYEEINDNSGKYYYVTQVANIGTQGPPTLLQITVRVRKNVNDVKNEVILTSHFLKN
ncbi:hypothetical protein JMF89_06150 [Clostridiaceae bacterium UIB06]|uniref:Prepilin-type N-terminal cleavage/methylation domain-containing protein n=1 Tax=Clostridium thailandense TaxID=2794346 RepID=A0A949TY68_9CLOT|nr:hypothetical protein [Clostridium thailandense]MBV7275756.1 hypothetical protein [Clostridium thailandense]MCH5136783.1 hypothetical protein [Clostridiaceae bacterium UIB06]